MAPVTLESLPDVLLDGDLCALMRITPRQLKRLKERERLSGVRYLPPTMPQAAHVRGRRYAKADVELWLRNGGRVLRRAS